MEHNNTGFIRQHQSKLAFISKVSDASIILVTLYASAWIHGIAWTEQYFTAGFVAVFCFYLVGENLRIYRSWRGVAFKQQLQAALFAWMLTLFGLLVLGYATKSTGTYSRLAVGVWMVSVPMFLIVWRLMVREILHYFRARGFNTRKVAIVTANELGDKLARHIQSTPSFGMDLAGFYEDRRVSDERTQDGLTAPILGNYDDLVQSAKQGELDLIYIAFPMKAEERIGNLIQRLSDTTASVYIVPNFFIFGLLHSRWVDVGTIPTISVFESPFLGIEGWVKRVEDIVLATLILAVIAIPMLFIALAVKLTSPGPVLFKQKRYGLDGRRIEVWKFRSMTACEDDDKVVQAKKGDCRITPIGAFLRRTSLDELPQFFNVLMGDMSIVGPRPHAVVHNEEYRTLIPGYMLRHKVKPGITGWAQINGWRGETDTLDKMEKRVEYDLWYIRSWSVWLDLKIVFKTIFKGFVGENAY